jgi:hypothetical protein
LREVLVPKSDRLKRTRSFRAHDVIDLAAENIAGFRRGNGHRDNQAAWPELVDCANGCQHSRPGCEPIIDKNDDASFNVERRSAFAVRDLASLQFPPLKLYDRIHFLLADASHVQNVVVENADSAARDCAQREFLMTRDAQLSHEEHIERCIEILGYFEPDRDSATRQREHKHIRATPILVKSFGQDPARIGSISEWQ